MQRQDLRSKGSGLRRSATIVERSSRTLLIDTISNFPCARMRIHRSFAFCCAYVYSPGVHGCNRSSSFCIPKLARNFLR